MCTESVEVNEYVGQEEFEGEEEGATIGGGM